MTILRAIFCALAICSNEAFKTGPIKCHGICKNRLSATTETSAEIEARLNPRDERRRIMKSSNYNRMGFKDEKGDVKDTMIEEFTSPLVAELRANNGQITRGDVTIKLAESYGFCWGVERAIAMAYEARSHFPDKTIHITNEIIHNPQVNERLFEMDIKLMDGPLGKKDYSVVQNGDVVILPAFGATIQEMQMLDSKGVQVVDTTCPWVSKVWNAVDNHRKLGQTSIIHGKYAHEETVATASFCDDYIIVKDMNEAEYVANYIVNGGDRVEFMEKFKNAVSKGFDPDVHLVKVGLANQTTMYKRETKAIGRLLEVTMLKKYGPENLAVHYAEFDTICDATQVRVHIYTYVHVCKGVCVFIYLRIYIYSHMYICIYIHLLILNLIPPVMRLSCVLTHIDMYFCVYIYVYVCVHMYTYLHIFSYVYV
jgi:4-hydroxy-3-methylbut-2-enyl diphosphate reductase